MKKEKIWRFIKQYGVAITIVGGAWFWSLLWLCWFILQLI